MIDRIDVLPEPERPINSTFFFCAMARCELALPQPGGLRVVEGPWEGDRGWEAACDLLIES